MDERPSVIVIAQLINPRAFFGEDKISCSVDVKKKKKKSIANCVVFFKRPGREATLPVNTESEWNLAVSKI